MTAPFRAADDTDVQAKAREAMRDAQGPTRPAQLTVALMSPAVQHTSGQVFDISYSNLPPHELECLRFILDDLGWEGDLGFVDDGPKNIHIGCAPSVRDFFSAVFQEAVEKNSVTAEQAVGQGGAQ